MKEEVGGVERLSGGAVVGADKRQLINDRKHLEPIANRAHSSSNNNNTTTTSIQQPTTHSNNNPQQPTATTTTTHNKNAHLGLEAKAALGLANHTVAAAVVGHAAVVVNEEHHVFGVGHAVPGQLQR